MSTTPDRESIDVKALRDTVLADDRDAARRAEKRRQQLARDGGWNPSPCPPHRRTSPPTPAASAPR